MLVRVSYTRDEHLGARFDESQSRTAQNMEIQDWVVFLVVWRGDRIEFYEDYVSRSKYSHPPRLYLKADSVSREDPWSQASLLQDTS